MERILWKICKYFSHCFSLAVLDESKGKWPVTPSPKNIPYLKAENASGRHILIKPDSAIQPYYFLADDLNNALLIRQHQLKPGVFKSGRMIIETSPGNYQVWIHSSVPLTLPKNGIGWGNCTATPVQTLKTDGADAPGSGTERQNIKRLQDSIHWQNSYGLIGNARRIFLK